MREWRKVRNGRRVKDGVKEVFVCVCGEGLGNRRSTGERQRDIPCGLWER